MSNCNAARSTEELDFSSFFILNHLNVNGRATPSWWLLNWTVWFYREEHMQNRLVWILFSGQWEGAGEAVGAEMGNDVLIQI